MDFDTRFARKEMLLPLEYKQLQKIYSSFTMNPHTEATLLAGGFDNLTYHLSIPNEIHDCILRVYGQRSAFDTEAAVMSAVAGKVPVPQVLDKKPNIKGYPCTLIEFIKGELLSKIENQLPDSDIEDLGSQIGTILANIHSFKFEKPGFFIKNFTVEHSFDNFYKAYNSYFTNYMNKPRIEKLMEEQERKTLQAYAKKMTPAIQALPQQNVLVHSDFNSKNIIVRQEKGRWKVAAILDWEFAFVAHPLVDFGNFFRFAPAMPKAYKAPLIKAYQDAGGKLPKNWQAMAQAMDMLAMVHFLTREPPKPPPKKKPAEDVVVFS